MNERYLFRGKRIDNGEWVQGYFVYCRKHHYILPDDICGFDERYHDWVEVDPATVSEYTGLRDKNGTHIFEKDIVTRIAPIYQLGKNEPVGEYEPIGVVSVIEDTNEPPYFTVKSRDHLGNDADMLLFVKASGWHRPWYVIGNFHDNPELLEEENV